EEEKIELVEGRALADHVHLCLSIPPKYSVANTLGFLKGKSAIRIHREHLGRERNFTGFHFWARGYCRSTVGLDEETVRQYIREYVPDLSRSTSRSSSATRSSASRRPRASSSARRASSSARRCTCSTSRSSRSRSSRSSSSAAVPS
ncbi:MAG: IS200/IS605 family transposase, partial [Deltaproteobacteria bacterium]|nr:IS200/IS605 family transposase [Deltaproteobacteria bacterium]